MAADAERAERIRALKAERPHLTWPQVAEGVGVTDRSVASWAKTGQISYSNAKKLANFLEVDLDWLWGGPKRESPDLMDALALPVLKPVEARLDQIETKLDDLLSRMPAYDPDLDRAELEAETEERALQSEQTAAEREEGTPDQQHQDPQSP